MRRAWWHTSERTRHRVQVQDDRSWPLLRISWLGINLLSEHAASAHRAREAARATHVDDIRVHVHHIALVEKSLCLTQVARDDE